MITITSLFYADQDGFLLPFEFLDSIQQLLTERCRQEEDASGKYALLFKHIDADNNGTIEKKGKALREGDKGRRPL